MVKGNDSSGTGDFDTGEENSFDIDTQDNSRDEGSSDGDSDEDSSFESSSDGDFEVSFFAFTERIVDLGKHHGLFVKKADWIY